MKYKIGKIIKGTVSGIENYGIFVSFDQLYSGMIHISEISNDFVKNIHNIVRAGDTIYVKIIDIDEKMNHLSLSIKDINYRDTSFQRKRKINETNLGFTTLKSKLPEWIKKSLKK